MIEKTKRTYLFLSTLAALGMAFHSATYVSFLLDNHLNLFQVNLVNVVFFLTTALMEVPTGVFADVYGRRASVLVSFVLMALGMGVYGASGGFWGFALAEFTIAIGKTFASGAFEAWVVDQLKHHGDGHASLEHLFSWEGVLDKVASIGGALVGAFMYGFSSAMPWYAGAAAYLLLLVLGARIMREDYFRHRSTHWREHLKASAITLREGFRYARSSPAVRFIALMTVAVAFATQAPNMQWQPFFRPYFHGEQTGLGLVWTLISVTAMAGAYAAPRLRRMLGGGFAFSIGVLILFTGIALGGTPLAGSSISWALFAFLMHEVTRGAMGAMSKTYLNQSIDSTERATILSFQSMWNYAGGAFGLLASGYVAEHLAISSAWMGSGGIMVVLGLLLAVRKRAGP